VHLPDAGPEARSIEVKAQAGRDAVFPPFMMPLHIGQLVNNDLVDALSMTRVKPEN
jgi:hypothetical protein